MPGSRSPQPPRLARLLLRHLLPARDREFLIGDLEESFAIRASAAGKRAARRWYWRASLASIASLGERDRFVAAREEPRLKGDGFMKNVLRDVKQGVRLLRRAPGFSVVAVVTLALGIGANTAIFTVAYSVLLKPLPYTSPDELVIVNESNISRGWPTFSVAPANFMDWRAQSTSFARLAAYGGASFNYTGRETPERLRALAGTEGFLEMLDASPVRGRVFQPQEFEPGRNRVVILSHAFWIREFGGRDDVLQQSISLNGQPYTIVGIMGPSWRFGGRDISLFTPRAFADDEKQARGGHYLGVIGRLKPGVSLKTAQAELIAIAARLENQYPDSNKGWSVAMVSLLDSAVGTFRPTMAVLLGAVGLVLLVACANLANMHLARATGRAKEMAIRAAIGAGRLRIVQQLLTESLVLSVAGGVAGLFIAYLATSAFVQAYPTLIPRSRDIGISGGVMAFTALLSILTAMLFGLAPAIAAARTRFTDTLKDGGRGGASRLSGLMRSALVVSEIALALVLLTGAGLLLRSFVQLMHVEPGFRTDHRLIAVTNLPQPKYAEPARAVDFYDRATAAISSEPDVESVALASIVPISGNDEIYSIAFEGRPPLPPGQGVSANYFLVSPNYFSTMGIPLLKGRVFTDEDRDGTTRVAVIDETFAKLHYPNENPIGQRIRMGRNSNIVREIVGVVGNVKNYGLRDKDTAQMYEPYRQMPYTTMYFIVKTTGDPMSAAPAFRREIQTVDRDQPVTNVASLEQLLADSGALSRVQAMLMATLGVIALLLAAIGLYGVMAYSVSQRTQEIGIRMTLGAHRGSVLRMVLSRALVLTMMGLAIGVAGAVALGHVLTSVLEPMLFHVAPTDAATLATVGAVLAVVAIAAALIPARRATRIDPIQALKAL